MCNVRIIQNRYFSFDKQIEKFVENEFTLNKKTNSMKYIINPWKNLTSASSCKKQDHIQKLGQFYLFKKMQCISCKNQNLKRERKPCIVNQLRFPIRGQIYCRCEYVIVNMVPD